jgi:hypothetical protein
VILDVKEMKPLVLLCVGFICLYALMSCMNVTENKSNLTPIPESTLMAYRQGTPAANKLQAVIAARVSLSGSRMESLQPPDVIFFVNG